MFVTLMYCARMVESIEMPIGVSSQVGQRNHVLDGGHWESLLRCTQQQNQ